jgi:predicted nucleic acid-binding protein
LTICADSSFLVSKYVQDSHSAEADRRMVSQPSVLLTPLHRAEIAHVIHQWVFRAKLSAADARQAWGDFEQDCSAGVWSLIGLPEGIWETSVYLAQRFGPTLGVRTLDSLHVACALELKARQFWTFDERQARLAQAVGLDTNP